MRGQDDDYDEEQYEDDLTEDDPEDDDYEDDDYEDDSEDDEEDDEDARFRSLVGEEEEDDYDEDDDEDDAEDYDEEDDEDDEDEEEGEPGLDDMFYKEDEEDDEDDSEDDGEDDEEQAENLSEDQRAVYMNLSHAELGRLFHKKASEAGEKVDPEFTLAWIESGRDVETLIENGVFNYDSLMEKYIEAVETADPNRRVMPHSTDLEGWREVLYDNLKIPKSVEDYGDDPFAGIDHAQDEAVREEYRKQFHSDMLSMQAARSQMVREHESNMAMERELKQRTRDYKIQEQKIMKEAYGDAYSDRQKEVLEVLHKHGKDFMDEFKGTKVVHSSAFLTMMRNLIHSRVELPEKTPTDAVQNMTDEELVRHHETIRNSKEWSDEWKHGSALQQKAHQRYDKAYDAIWHERKRRNV